MFFDLNRFSFFIIAGAFCALVLIPVASIGAQPDAPGDVNGSEARKNAGESASSDADEKSQPSPSNSQPKESPSDAKPDSGQTQDTRTTPSQSDSRRDDGGSEVISNNAEAPLTPEELERRRLELDLPHPYGPPEFRYDENHFGLDQSARERFIDRIQWRLRLWTSFNYFDNSDLRALNSRNETSIEETDDRLYFIYSGAEVGLFFPVNPHLDIRMDIWKVGFWGHDQLGGRDNNNDARDSPAGSNTVNFGNLYFDIHIQKEPARERRLDLIIGRQPYELGGEIYRDYLLDDQLDSVVLRWYGWLGRLDLLLLDVFASGSDTEDVNFVQYLSFDEEKVDGFDGDVNTYRQGLTYRLPVYGDADLGGTHFDGRVFYYYARFGGVNDGGADRTNDGTIPTNEADKDFSFMRGFRLNAGYKNWFRTSFTYAESFGIDRKQTNELLLPVNDVDNNGKSYALDIEFNFFNNALIITPTYFFADGGRYHIDGRQYGHGFVGFKGQHAGGILTNLNWGLHPSAYIDDDGIDDTPYERDRKSGTEVKHIGLKFGWPFKFYFLIDWWRLTDTSNIGAFGQSRRKAFAGILNNDDPHDPYTQAILLGLASQVFPTQTAALGAARRFGAPLGEELNFGIEWHVMQNWKVWATVGAFYPMRYFSTVGLVQDAPQGTSRFVGFQMGMKLVF